jgi:hypothetical protein
VIIRHSGIVEELELDHFGLRYVDCDPWGFAPAPVPGDAGPDGRPLLLQVYDAQPDWAEAFARWQRAHRKKYHADEAEAAAFTAFRDNVLAAVRSGRPLALDERSDLSGETRRTLSHFA